MNILKPQAGFQEDALSTPADIAFVGGSAGGGKTMLLLMESTRNVENQFYGGIIFRRTTPQIKNEGALWDTSQKVYPLCGGEPRESTNSWRWESGAKMKFSHLEHDSTVLNYQGAQIPFIGFDELTHFSSYQFWYMLSRNRDPGCGVRPYIRAGCNPDPKSWVAKMIEFYINQNTGYPIKEHSGRMRYFTRDGEAVVWGDSKAEVIEKCPHIFKNEQIMAAGVKVDDLVKSFTFIAGNIFENKIFIKNDPTYLGTLMALPPEEKSRLLDGNWKISLDGLMIVDWGKLQQIFDNYPEQAERPRKYITVDAARFGRDFAVIYVWKGWEVIFTVVYKISDAHGLNDRIEWLRMRFNVMRDDVIVDADGVGDGTVKLGQYTPFHGGNTAYRDDVDNIKLHYYNLKTQCWFRFLQKRVNLGQCRFSINSQTCLIFDGSTAGGQYTTRLMVGGEVKDVRDLLKEDLASARRLETPNEGVDKVKMEPKEQQKNILNRSPDFGDAAIMREYAELMPQRKGMRQSN